MILTSLLPSLPKIESRPQVGLRKRPAGCRACPMDRLGTGFVLDERPERPIIAIQLEAPGRDEAFEGRPLVGRSGGYFFRKILGKLGKERKDVIICNTLRCRPTENIYPVGAVRQVAERCCRQYDAYHQTPDSPDQRKGGLVEWRANLIVVTEHPAALLRTDVMYRLIVADLAKAFRFAERGFRPLVLMGDKAAGQYLPLEGGLKRWRGHWMEL